MSDHLSKDTLDTIEQAASGFTEEQKARYPWHSLVGQQRSEEALSEIEHQMKELPDDPFCRLWWIRCQLELDSLPTTALSAPLDEMHPLLEQDPALQKLCCATYLRTALKLIEKNQYRLSVVMLERALGFSSFLSAGNRSSLEEFFADNLKDEIQRAQLRRESRTYITALEAKRESLQLRAERQDSGAENGKADGPRRSERLTSKKILSEAAAEQAEQEEVQESVKKRLGSRLFAAAAVPAMLGAGLWGLWHTAFRPQSAALPEGVAMALQSSDTPDMTMPSIRGRASELDRTLDNVGLRLQRLALASDSRQDSAAAQKEAPIDHDALDPKHAESLREQMAPENDELVSISRIPRAENAIPENSVPQLDPNDLPSMPVESIGSSGKKAPIPTAAMDGLRVDSAGRVYGAPKASDPAGAQGRALDGSPLRSYEVEQFDPPLVYKTIARTRVASAPSLLSETLAELNADTPVHVTARMGRWLELRSTGGKVGYIYSQDARPSDAPMQQP